ncbi:MAG: hypothetical protein MRY63_03885 [Neomegalonema sp.]|nr:hypothetical protein [Neomegalonema sp.]
MGDSLILKLLVVLAISVIVAFVLGRIWKSKTPPPEPSAPRQHDDRAAAPPPVNAPSQQPADIDPALLAERVPHVGYQSHKISDPVTGLPVPLFLFYPTHHRPERLRVGPFQFEAAEGGKPDPIRGVVLVSHGAASSGMAHHPLARYLARRGYLVVAPTHARDNALDPRASGKADTLRGRILTISAALDFVLSHPEFPGLADRPVALIGNSQGTATALALGGAQMDTGRGARHCAEHPDDALCGYPLESLSRIIDQADPRIKALILMAPTAVYFEDEALRNVKVPVLLWQAGKDGILTEPWHAERLARLLPNLAGHEKIAPGGHASFVAPIPFWIDVALPSVLRDPSGFDRAPFQRDQLHPSVAHFLARVLEPARKKEPL